MLITEKPETVFDTSEIKAGYLVFAKNRSWNEGIGGFKKTVDLSTVFLCLII